MTGPRATGLGGPRNGLPEPKRYRWHGQPPPPAPVPPQPGDKHPTPRARQERLEALAGLRVSDQNLSRERLPHGVLTCEEAARMFGVTKRTIIRDLRALREVS